MFYALFISFFILICYFDIKSLFIPLYLNIPLLLLSLLYSFLLKIPAIFIFLNPAIGFLFIFFIHIITKKGIGLGDAILSASIAAILGINYWLLAMTTASLMALTSIFYMKLIKKKNIRYMRIPFAPYMIVGAVIFFVYRYFIN